MMIHPGFFQLVLLILATFRLNTPLQFCVPDFWCREFSEARSGVTPPLTARRTGCLFPWILQVTVVAGNSSSYHTLYWEYLPGIQVVLNCHARVTICWKLPESEKMRAEILPLTGRQEKRCDYLAAGSKGEPLLFKLRVDWLNLIV